MFILPVVCVYYSAGNELGMGEYVRNTLRGNITQHLGEELRDFNMQVGEKVEENIWYLNRIT